MIDVPTVVFAEYQSGFESRVESAVSSSVTVAYGTIGNTTVGTSVGSARVEYAKASLSAIDVRRQWMAMMGLGQDEVDQYCADDAGSSVEDELRQLVAMIEVQRIYDTLGSSR